MDRRSGHPGSGQPGPSRSSSSAHHSNTPYQQQPRPHDPSRAKEFNYSNFGRGRGRGRGWGSWPQYYPNRGYSNLDNGDYSNGDNGDYINWNNGDFSNWNNGDYSHRNNGDYSHRGRGHYSSYSSRGRGEYKGYDITRPRFPMPDMSPVRTKWNPQTSLNPAWIVGQFEEDCDVVLGEFWIPLGFTIDSSYLRPPRTPKEEITEDPRVPLPEEKKEEITIDPSPEERKENKEGITVDPSPEERKKKKEGITVDARVPSSEEKKKKKKKKEEITVNRSWDKKRGGRKGYDMKRQCIAYLNLASAAEEKEIKKEVLEEGELAESKEKLKEGEKEKKAHTRSIAILLESRIRKGVQEMRKKRKESPVRKTIKIEDEEYGLPPISSIMRPRPTMISLDAMPPTPSSSYPSLPSLPPPPLAPDIETTVDGSVPSQEEENNVKKEEEEETKVEPPPCPVYPKEEDEEEKDTVIPRTKKQRLVPPPPPRIEKKCSEKPKEEMDADDPNPWEYGFPSSTQRVPTPVCAPTPIYKMYPRTPLYLDPRTPVISTKKRPRSRGSMPQPHQQQQHPSKPQQPFRPYKLVADKALGALANIKRIEGRCDPQYSQHDDISKPHDPRSRFRRITIPNDLATPRFTLDDQYTGTPPLREVTIFDLNDNANEQFLEKMSEKFDAEEVVVTRRPITHKHLGMAFILFKKCSSARAFIDANNGKSVMGTPIRCVFDPFGAQLAEKFSEKTSGDVMPRMKYLEAMSEEFLQRRRDETLGKRDVPASPSPMVESASSPHLQYEPMDVSDDNGSRPPSRNAYAPPPAMMRPPSREECMETQRQPRPRTPAEMRREPPLLSMGGRTPPEPPPGPPPVFVAEPPPPYSERPPRHHSTYSPTRDARKRTATTDERGRNVREKRRRHCSSSSSSSSRSRGGHPRTDRSGSRGVAKSSEVVKIKSSRYVSTERDRNGEKRRVEEIRTVHIKRTERIENRSKSRSNSKSPDSFDEEMKRRERVQKEGSSGRRRGERKQKERGQGLRWSSSSSDSDNGKSRRGKRREQPRTFQDDRSLEKKGEAAPPSTPISSSQPSNSTSTPVKSRGFSDVAPFDPNMPPPSVVLVPPVGLVHPTVPFNVPPPMVINSSMAPPPPLPGGFIPPPQMFGFPMGVMMTPGASSTPHTGTPGTPAQPPPPLPPPPSTVLPTKTHVKRMEERDEERGRRTPREKERAGPSTPPLSCSGSNTPSSLTGANAGSSSSSPKKKGTLDDRLSVLFGIQKKAVEEAHMRHAASAPTLSSQDTAANEDALSDDAMDVASSSSSAEAKPWGRPAPRSTRMASPTPQSAEHRAAIANANLQWHNSQMELTSEWTTAEVFNVLMNEMVQVIERDLGKTVEKAAFEPVEQWSEKRKHAEDERRKEQIRQSMLAAEAKNSSTTTTPVKDPMEAMLEAKLKSPDGKFTMPSVYSLPKFIIQKRKKTPSPSRENTPLSQPSSRRGSPVVSSDEEDAIERRRKGPSTPVRETHPEEKRRPGARMRNAGPSLECSSESSSSESSSEEDEDEEEEGVGTADSSADSSDVEVDENVDEDEKKRLVGLAKQVLKVVEEKEVKEIQALRRSSRSRSGSLEKSIHVSREEEMKQEVKEEVKEEEVEEEKEEEEEEDDNEDPMTHHESMRVKGHLEYNPHIFDHCYFAKPIPERPSLFSGQKRKGPPEEGAARTRALSMLVEHKKKTAPPAVVVPAPTVVAPKKTKDEKKKEKKEKEELVAREVRKLLEQEGVYSRPSDSVARVERKVFNPWAPEERERIFNSYKAGMDQEDEMFLKKKLEMMQADGKRPFMIGGPGTGHPRQPFQGIVPFVSHLRAETPAELPAPRTLEKSKVDVYFADEELAGVVPHSTGCARTEGFYRWTHKQKIRIMRRPEGYHDKTEISERDEIATRHQVQATREQKANNRRLMNMVETNPNSDFFKVNQLKFRKKMIKFARSRIHGWGLYALEPIAPDDMIVEYVGQKIRPIVADLREKQYERRGIGSSYLFRIDEDEVIDATRTGNFARFINHSCQPNCYAKVVTVDGDKRIVIYSKTLINKGDEITYDYKFPIEDDKVECLCGAAHCRGTLN